MDSELKIRKTFARNLSSYLELRKKTQKELADYLGVSGTTVTNWVRGYKMPRMDKIDKICSFLTIGRNSLLSDSVRMQDAIKEKSFQLSSNEKTIIKKFRALTPEGKETVLTILDLQYKSVAPKVKNDEVI